MSLAKQRALRQLRLVLSTPLRGKGSPRAAWAGRANSHANGFLTYQAGTLRGKETSARRQPSVARGGSTKKKFKVFTAPLPEGRGPKKKADGRERKVPMLGTTAPVPSPDRPGPTSCRVVAGHFVPKRRWQPPPLASPVRHLDQSPPLRLNRTPLSLSTAGGPKCSRPQKRPSLLSGVHVLFSGWLYVPRHRRATDCDPHASPSASRPAGRPHRAAASRSSGWRRGRVTRPSVGLGESGVVLPGGAAAGTRAGGAALFSSPHRDATLPDGRVWVVKNLLASPR